MTFAIPKSSINSLQLATAPPFPPKVPSSPLPGNLPFKFDMAGILIAPQRHSDNFTTKRGWGGRVLFSALIKRATVLDLSPRADSWHQTGENLELSVATSIRCDESGAHEGELQLFE